MASRTRSTSSVNSVPAMGFELGRRADADGVKLLDVAVLVAGEFDGVDAPVANAAFFVRAFGAQLQRPQRPGRGCGALGGRLGHDFELVNARGALAMAGAEAVGAGVAAADDDDALAGGEDGAGGFHGGEELFFRVAFVAAILLRQELHGVVNALELAAGNGQVARMLGAAAEQDGVVVSVSDVDGDVDADVRVGVEDDAFGAHLLDAAIEDVLLKLEVGNAVAEQAADAVVLLVDGDGVAGAAKLLRGGEAGGAAADDGDALAGGLLGRLGVNPALVPCAFDDGALDELDGDGRLIDAEHA